MIEALREIGLKKAAKFGLTTLAMAPWRFLLFPQARVPYLRALGAKIGEGTLIHDVTLFNLYRVGFPGLVIGRKCFIGDECLIDLAERVELKDEVTLAERVTVLTHTNVGYADHPLQEFFPAFSAPVVVERGAFIGTNATLMPGVTVGECAFVAAGSVVVKDVPPRTLVAGVPAKVIRQIDGAPK